MEKPPPTIRTGLGTGSSKKIEKTSPMGQRLIGLVFVLIKRAATTAAMYCSHSKRRLVTTRDVGLAMRYHAMTFLSEHGFDQLEKDVVDMEEMVSQFVNEEATSSDVIDTFVGEEDIQEEIEEETEEEIEEESEEEEHVCECETCQGIRNTDWDAWHPEDPAEMFLKTHIDDVFSF